MLCRHPLRLIALSFLVIATALSPLNGGRVTPGRAAVSQSSGLVPWHPHLPVRMADGLNATVDLADGHVDVQADAYDLPARGLNLTVRNTWDSTLAQAGTTTTAGEGWENQLTQNVSTGAGNKTYTDANGTAWLFTLGGGTYQSPAGFPWQLDPTASRLTNILTGEVLAFSGSGAFLSDTDSYGNANTLTTNSPSVQTFANSGGRSLTVNIVSSVNHYASLQSYSRQVTFGYSIVGGKSYLTTLTRGAGSTEAEAEQFAYTGNLLTSVTTGAGHVWTLGYTGNQLTTVTSPISGTVGQAGYTPAYTTQITYNTGSTVVVEGSGTSAAVTFTITLDGQGQATAVADGLSHTNHISFDADHDVQTFMDANGNLTTYHFQYIGSGLSYGLLTETDSPAINPNFPSNTSTAPVAHYAYDPTTNDLIEEYDNNGMHRFYAYDGHHSPSTVAELVSTTVVGGATTYHWRGRIYGYNAFGELTSRIDGRGVSVPDTTSQSTAPPVSANAQASSYTHAWAYTPQGDEQTSATPPITTTLNGTQSTGPATTTYGYDPDGNRITAQSANGNTTSYAYDALERLISTALPGIALFNFSPPDIAISKSTIAYDKEGNISQRQDGNENPATTDSYDPLGRLVSSTNAISGTTIFTYTAINLISWRDPIGNMTAYTSDAAGRQISRVDAANEHQQYGYDIANNLTSITYGDGTTTSSLDTRTYDALGELATDTISSASTPALATTYSYDLHGNLVREQHPNGDVTFNTYDLADQLINREIDKGNPNTPSHTKQETFGFDLAGNPVSQTDYRNDTTAFTIDGDSRVTQRVDTYATSPTITTAVAYDPDGNRVSQTQNDGSAMRTYTVTYNTADWPATKNDDGLGTSYAGDGAGHQISYTIQNGSGTVGIDPDNAGRWNSLNDGTNTSTFSYNGNDLPFTMLYPGGVTQSIQYDGASRLTQITAKGPGLNSKYTYGYDPAGWTNSVGTSLNGGATVTQTLTHDALARLTGSTGGTITGSWQYDGHGNLTSSTTNGTISTYSYDPVNADELTSVSTAGQPTVNYGYDASGHTTSINNGGAINTALTYDAQGRLATVTLAGGTTVAITYNAQGQRATYTATGSGVNVSEHFQYRGSQLAQVTVTGASAYTDTYLYRQDGSPLELLRQTGGTTNRYWYQVDGRHNVVALTTSSGTVVDQYQYDLWGKPTSISETVRQQLRYAGYWYDNELCWYWLSVRSYDPVLERFLQPDPSELEGLFSYVYVGDNPIDGTDPSGLESILHNPDKTVDAGDTGSEITEDLSEGATLIPNGLSGALSGGSVSDPRLPLDSLGGNCCST